MVFKRPFINWRIALTAPIKTTNLLSIKDYAKKHYIHIQTVRYHIATYKVVAYKIKNKWWIYDDSP